LEGQTPYLEGGGGGSLGQKDGFEGQVSQMERYPSGENPSNKKKVMVMGGRRSSKIGRKFCPRRVGKEAHRRKSPSAALEFPGSGARIQESKGEGVRMANQTAKSELSEGNSPRSGRKGFDLVEGRFRKGGGGNVRFLYWGVPMLGELKPHQSGKGGLGIP